MYRTLSMTPRCRIARIFCGAAALLKLDAGGVISCYLITEHLDTAAHNSRRRISVGKETIHILFPI